MRLLMTFIPTRERRLIFDPSIRSLERRLMDTTSSILFLQANVPGCIKTNRSYPVCAELFTDKLVGSIFSGRIPTDKPPQSSTAYDTFYRTLMAHVSTKTAVFVVRLFGGARNLSCLRVLVTAAVTGLTCVFSHRLEDKRVIGQIGNCQEICPATKWGTQACGRCRAASLVPQTFNLLCKQGL